MNFLYMLLSQDLHMSVIYVKMGFINYQTLNQTVVPKNGTKIRSIEKYIILKSFVYNQTLNFSMGNLITIIKIASKCLETSHAFLLQ